jgi:tyrosine-protein kinase Etk/Wzc
MRKRTNISLLDYIEVIVRWRKFILRNVLIVAIFTAAISMVLIHKYRVTATILPPSPEQQSMLGMLSVNVPSALSGLARIGGGMLPGLTTPSDLYAAIIKSQRIRRTIIEKYDLKREFKAKTEIDALDALDRITEVSVSPEGLISVSVTYKNKFLATDIANSFIEELDKFNTETAMTVGKRYRMFIEARLNESIDSLALAEEKLRGFQEQHRTIALDIEIENVINTIAELKSNIILLEVKRGALSSSSQFDNPYFRDINRELNELKKQLTRIEFGRADSTKEFGAGFSIPLLRMPEVSLEYARLLRDVKVQEAIYGLLTEQYEQAKIMEVKDTPTVQILDEAKPPEKSSFPRRTIIVIIAIICSFVLSILYIFVLTYIQTGGINKESLEKVRNIWHMLKKDFYSLTKYLKK